MRPFTSRCTIDAPRERVFDYLIDIANHAEFTDGFLEEFRLERLESRGIGAAARFRVRLLPRVWAEAVITAAEPPHLIALDGRAGREGRVATRIEYRLTPADHEMTRVEVAFSTEPATATDRFLEGLGARARLRRDWRRALVRLKRILEEGEPSSRAVRVASG